MNMNFASFEPFPIQTFLDPSESSKSWIIDSWIDFNPYLLKWVIFSFYCLDGLETQLKLLWFLMLSLYISYFLAPKHIILDFIPLEYTY